MNLIPHFTISIAVLFLQLIPVLAHDDKLAGEHRDVYLTEQKGFMIETTDKDIKIHSKQNLKKLKDDDMFHSAILIPSAWAKDLVLAVHVYTIKNGKKFQVGDFPLHNYKEFGSSGLHAFAFALRKMNFKDSVIVFDTRKESVYVHLTQKKAP
ncbi:MAG: hypothetical protein KJO21_01985 [Verrucomicrobiae bacterium]|nr:hypothetical protein [Verrucomicrobiae bacterium]NNJ44068.1 hypothetical protein [Akkermansiaceae bacterium]